MANQKLRDRFHGENDPLANKIMRRAEEDLTLMPPEDKSITTLYLGGLPAGGAQRGGALWGCISSSREHRYVDVVLRVGQFSDVFLGAFDIFGSKAQQCGCSLAH